MSKLRTFIAVEAAPPIRKRALELIERLRPTQANVKWVGAAELHWTLKFLGDVTPLELPDLCDALEEAASDVPPFEIGAIGAGAFPEISRPRTVWLGVGEGEAEFVALHDRIKDALAPLGFREEQRRFRPHLTLGRVRRSPEGVDELGQLIADHATFPGGQMTVSELVIFSSRLERHGPVYEALSRVPLS